MALSSLVGAKQTYQTRPHRHSKNSSTSTSTPPNNMSSHSTLDAAATDRKARLAKLASVKRKRAEPEAVPDDDSLENKDASKDDIAAKILSGRNYDPETRGPKLGFEHAPIEDTPTLEDKASGVAKSISEAAKKQEADQLIDIFKLQPKKPNWDLKRDLNEKLKVLNVRTDNAVARLVRERIQTAQKVAKTNPEEHSEEGEEVGIAGAALVEGVHLRELEKAEDFED